MPRIDQQITLADVDPHYQAFVDKFKPKKTTDDCYTPENIYKVVLNWVVKEYGIDPNNIVRPFWPGGDYMNEDYPEGCTVVDNPPFSIIAEIVNNYNSAGIKYFLFAPYLTNFGTREKTSHIITRTDITYKNGANVSTAFLTNLDTYLLRSCPDLAKQIEEANKANIARVRKQVPKYKYPDYVVTATDLGYLAKWGIDFRVMAKDCFFIRALDSQKPHGKTIFGSGFLLSESAAAEKAAAEKAAAEKAAAEKAAAKCWELSESEYRIIQSLGHAHKHEGGTNATKQIKTPQRGTQTARKPIPCDYIHSLIVQPENAGDKSRVLSWLLRKWNEESELFIAPTQYDDDLK